MTIHLPLRTDAAAGFPHHIHNAAGSMVAETCSEELAVYLVKRANVPVEPIPASVAGNRLRDYLRKASFSSAGDRFSAIECLESILAERANAPAEALAPRITADYWQGRAATAERQRDALLALLRRYRYETPLGQQPEKAPLADKLIAEVEKEQSRDAHR